MSVPTTFAQWKKGLKYLATQVGHTPLVRIQRAWSKPQVEIYAKLEWEQLGNSVKTRPALYMIREAVEQERLTPGRHIFDSTSGNTGISYAAIGSYLDVPVTTVMPEDASEERKTILRALGAELLLVSADMTSDEVSAYTQQLADQHPDRYCYLNQYDNPANAQAHYESTGPEIYEQTLGRITHFVSSLGTCGTFTGTARFFRDHHPHVQCMALHPDVADHELEGWKHLASSQHPKIYDPSLVNTSYTITTEESLYWVKQVAAEEGLLISPSSAGALAGAIKVAEQIDKGVIVTVFPDDAAKYGAIYRRLFG
jgi:S-sulfo-L-cysteine synthase (O-acetyl-L-serine-dependent)